tara:strand:+ start:192 stop:1022 length:831 start_codon:yes stop_codon:yes gene_type:complete
MLNHQAQGDSLEGKNIVVYGFNIHYVEIGSGPVLILLHGLWGGTNEWMPIIKPLAKNYRVIAMDFLGFHGSDKPEAKYHNALLAQFLHGFISKMKLDKVTLIGHAMGANAATYTAFHYPQNIEKLVLIDGAGYRNPNRDLSKPPSAMMISFRRIVTGSNIEETEKFLKRRVLNKSLITPQWTEEAFYMWLNSARAIGDMLQEGGDLSEQEMRQIKIPALILWGSDDQVFPIKNAEKLSTDLTNSTVKIIADSGHLPQIEQTEILLNALIPFLESYD